MLTNEGQIEKLNLFINSGKKYAMLINMPEISRKTTLKDVKESVVPGPRNSYERQVITGWSTPRISSGGNAEAYGEATFGPFTAEVPVTHVGIATTEDNSGVLYMFTPIQYFVENQEPRLFQGGEVFTVSLREEQV